MPITPKGVGATARATWFSHGRMASFISCSVGRPLVDKGGGAMRKEERVAGLLPSPFLGHPAGTSAG